jgi:hypothetical protein
MLARIGVMRALNRHVELIHRAKIILRVANGSLWSARRSPGSQSASAASNRNSCSAAKDLELQQRKRPIYGGLCSRTSRSRLRVESRVTLTTEPAGPAVLTVERQITNSTNDDISKKALALTEQNMKSAFEYGRKLLHAKDIQEVLQIQGEFFKGQLAAAQEQMKQMGTGAVSAVKDLEQDLNKS